MTSKQKTEYGLNYSIPQLIIQRTYVTISKSSIQSQAVSLRTIGILNMLPVYTFVLLLTSTWVDCTSMTQTSRALRGYSAEPTALAQFLPFIGTEIPKITSGNGFANNHVTKLAASIFGKGSGNIGSLRMLTVNTGEYSHQISVYNYPWFTTTYMSCSGATEESVRTCVWTVESSSSRDVTELQTDTYTVTSSGTSVSTYTWNSTGFVWDEYEPSTLTETVTIRDHIRTITMDMLVHPTIASIAATTSQASEWPTPT